MDNSFIKSEGQRTKAYFSSIDVSRNTRSASERTYRIRQNRMRPAVSKNINIGKWLLLSIIAFVILFYLFG